MGLALLINVSSVTDMNGMFMNASSFNQDISDWNIVMSLIWRICLMRLHLINQSTQMVINGM